MPAAGQGLLARLRAQDGFTLPELLLVVALVPIVLIGALRMLDTSARLVPQNVEYANAIQDAGAGAARIARDLRSAYRIVGTTPNSVTFFAYLNGVNTQINISCDIPGSAPPGSGLTYRRCVRTTAAAGATLGAPGSGQVVVDRVLNGTAEDPVFAFSPDPIYPTYVGLRLRVPSRGESADGFTHPIAIDNGALLRNATVGT